MIKEDLEQLEAALAAASQAREEEVTAWRALARAYQAHLLQMQMDLKQAEGLLQWVLKLRVTASTTDQSVLLDRLYEAINRFTNREELRRGTPEGSHPA